MSVRVLWHGLARKYINVVCEKVVEGVVSIVEEDGTVLEDEGVGVKEDVTEELELEKTEDEDTGGEGGEEDGGDEGGTWIVKF